MREWVGATQPSLVVGERRRFGFQPPGGATSDEWAMMGER
jgi:hypothetical protein